MIAEGYCDTTPAYAQILAHPEAWDTVPMRREHPQSPHRETSDCWLRYNPLRNYHGDVREFNAEHDAEWYPEAAILTECRSLAERVCADFEVDKLGFVLLTRIPAGKQVYPHIDQGWHAHYYEKFCISIRANAEQAFHFADCSLTSRSGDLFTFDNSFPHWVTNKSADERLSLIVCIHRS